MDFLQQYKAYLASIGSMFSGELGLQGSGFSTQMIGLCALLIGLLIFYIFVRMVLRTMGLMIAFAVIIGIAGYVVTSVGGGSGTGAGTISRQMSGAVGQAQSGTESLKNEFNQSIDNLVGQVKGMGSVLR